MNFFILFILTVLRVVNALPDCDFAKYDSGCDDSANIYCDYATQMCECKPNYSLKVGDIMCLKSINEECSLSHECSHISNAKCITNDGFELRGTQLHYIRDYRSRIWHKNSVIKRRYVGFCKCIPRYQYDSHREECILKVIGSTCNDDKHCSLHIANTECISGVCECVHSHYHLNDTCILRRKYNQFCTDKSECRKNFHCDSTNHCKCIKNYNYDAQTGNCEYNNKTEDVSQLSTFDSNKLLNNISKVGGFVVVLIILLVMCMRRDAKDTISKSSVRRRSTSIYRSSRRRSSSVNSHRPLTQTSSNASRSSAYRTFEDRQIIIPMPLPMNIKMTRSASSSSSSAYSEIEYNPYLFDSLFPQNQISDNDDPPSYEDVVNDNDNH